ncbi:MAG: prepilin-type N-terminal cleavage/methylation domain-containing protein [Magnetococcus sp. WYHC-3]
MAQGRYGRDDARRGAGFSLIELVIVIIVVGTIGAVAVPLMAPMMLNFVYTKQITDGQEHARLIVERIGREMRSSVGFTGDSENVTSATTLQFQFEEDLGNGTSAPAVTVQYAFNSTTQELTRSENGGPALLMGRVKNLVFRDSGAGSTVPSLEIEMEVDYANDGSTDVNLWTKLYSHQ